MCSDQNILFLKSRGIVGNVIESFRKYINNDRINNLQIFGIEIHRCAEKHALHSTPITLTARGKGLPELRAGSRVRFCVSH